MSAPTVRFGARDGAGLWMEGGFELHRWPDPGEAMARAALISAAAPARRFTWWVVPPAKKDRPTGQLSLAGEGP